MDLNMEPKESAKGILPRTSCERESELEIGFLIWELLVSEAKETLG